MGRALQANEPAFTQVSCRAVDHPDLTSTFPDQATGGELSRWSHVQEKASLTCATMVILNIPYTYPKSALQWDIDQLGLLCTGFHYPTDRKNKNRSRGFAFAKFATSEAAHMFQKLFHHRVLSYPGSPAKNVSVVPSESCTTSGQNHTGNHGNHCDARSETARWPLHGLAAPPGLEDQSSVIVDPRAIPVPLPIFEDGTVVLRRISL